MYRHLFFSILLFFISLSVFAETPLECAKKHPKANIVLFSKGDAKSGSDLDFGIERIAIYSTDFKVYIKKANSNEEFIRYIKDSVGLKDNGWTLKLDGGGAVVVLPSKSLFIYVPSSNSATMAAYDIDYIKVSEYLKITGISSGK